MIVLKKVFPGALFLSMAMTSWPQTFVTLDIVQAPELRAYAGEDIMVFADSTLLIGGSPAAAGGEEPYWYEWSDGNQLISLESRPSIAVTGNQTYLLTVTDNNGCTAFDTVQVILDMTARMDHSTGELRIYPNPAKEHFFVEIPAERASLELIHPDGRLLWSVIVEGSLLFRSPDDPGVYLLIYRNGSKEFIRKIVFE